MVAFGIIACSMPEVFADYPQRHLLATSWALCFRKIYVYHIIIFVCLRSNYECKDTYFFYFSQIFFYLSQSVCEIFPCQCNHSMARCSRYASCHLFYYLLYIVGPAVLLALLFFNLTFIALGSSYIPTEHSIICMFRKHFENILPFSEIIFVFLQAYLLIL